MILFLIGQLLWVSHGISFFSGFSILFI